MGIHSDPEGTWVRFTDYEAERDALALRLGEACELLSDMLPMLEEMGATFPLWIAPIGGMQDPHGIHGLTARTRDLLEPKRPTEVNP